MVPITTMTSASKTMLTTIQNRRARCMPLCLQVIASFIVYVTTRLVNRLGAGSGLAQGAPVAGGKHCLPRHGGVRVVPAERTARRPRDDAQLAPVVIVSIHPQKLAGLEGSHGR
jgi:hypothetical protein